MGREDLLGFGLGSGAAVLPEEQREEQREMKQREGGVPVLVVLLCEQVQFGVPKHTTSTHTTVLVLMYRAAKFSFLAGAHVW